MKKQIVAFGLALQIAVCTAAEIVVYPQEFPEGLVVNAKLNTSDGTINGNMYCSLTGGYELHNWSDGEIFTGNETEKIYYIPSGLQAITQAKTQTVFPVIYSSGSVCPRAGKDKTTTFNDLRLLGGGCLVHAQKGKKLGNITIQAHNPNNPALLDYAFSEVYDVNTVFQLGACIAGLEDSQLLYTHVDEKMDGKGFLCLIAGSDWSKYKGTLSIDDGFGIMSCDAVPVIISGSTRFGDKGVLSMISDEAPYSFGNLSFLGNGAITNTGVKASLTVARTFDTGINCVWVSRNTGTFGTLKLGAGLTLIDDQVTPTTILTVTNKLEVGENVVIEYPNAIGVVQFDSNQKRGRVLFMKLTQGAALEANLPDLSSVKVLFKDDCGYLTAEKDAETGDILVYATIDVSSYTGKDGVNSSGVRTDSYDDWLTNAEAWDDGQLPDDGKAYFSDKRVCFYPGGATTFPGRKLFISKVLYLFDSAIVSDLVLMNGGTIGVKDKSELRLGGNLTVLDTGSVCSISVFPNMLFYLDSALHGEGDIKFTSKYEAGTVSTYFLSADNSDWTGDVITEYSNKYSEDEKNHVCIVVEDFKSLGGNPDKFTSNSIILRSYAEIRFTKTSFQTASNRGMMVYNGILNVDSTATAELSAPVTLKGMLHKIGDGTLGLSGGIRWVENDDLTDATLPDADNNKIFVKAGAIKGSSLANADVTFSNGASIAADTKSGAMDLSKATVTAQGIVYLKADDNIVPEPTHTIAYPVVKLSSDQATVLDSKLKISKLPWNGRWQGSIIKSSPDSEGNIIYSVKYSKGLVMSLR